MVALYQHLDVAACNHHLLELCELWEMGGDIPGSMSLSADMRNGVCVLLSRKEHRWQTPSERRSIPNHRSLRPVRIPPIRTLSSSRLKACRTPIGPQGGREGWRLGLRSRVSRHGIEGACFGRERRALTGSGGRGATKGCGEAGAGAGRIRVWSRIRVYRLGGSTRRFPRPPTNMTCRVYTCISTGNCSSILKKKEGSSNLRHEEQYLVAIARPGIDV